MKKKTLGITAIVATVAGITFAGPAAAEGNAENGEKLAKRCIACHSFEEGGPNKVGPNLFNVVAQPGANPEFKFSRGFAEAVEAGFEWSDDNLAAYLGDPTGFVREVTGNDKARSKMTYKIKDEQDRKDLVAYLHTLK